MNPSTCRGALAPGLSISALAKALGITQRSLRHYEDLGMLRPRRLKGRRLYDATQQNRARSIAELRGLGVSLQDIGRALDDTREEGQRLEALVALLAMRLDEIDARAWRMQALLSTLRAGGTVRALYARPPIPGVETCENP